MAALRRKVQATVDDAIDEASADVTAVLTDGVLGAGRSTALIEACWAIGAGADGSALLRGSVGRWRSRRTG